MKTKQKSSKKNGRTQEAIVNDIVVQIIRRLNLICHGIYRSYRTINTTRYLAYPGEEIQIMIFVSEIIAHTVSQEQACDWLAKEIISHNYFKGSPYRISVTSIQFVEYVQVIVTFINPERWKPKSKA